MGAVVETVMTVGRGVFVLLFYPTVFLLFLIIGGFTLHYLFPVMQFVFDFLN